VKTLVNKLIGSSILIFLLVIASRVALYFIFPDEDGLRGQPGDLFFSCADFEYLSTIDNFVDFGVYSLTPNGVPFAGRLPGFIFPYLIFRLIFAKKTAYFLLGLFIMLYSAFSAIFLVKLIKERTGSDVYAFVALMALYMFPFYWFWDWTLHPNSLAASSLILSIFCLHRYELRGHNKYLLLAGILLSWIFMLRGFTLLFLPATLIVIVLWQRKRLSKLQLTRSVTIFLFPFLIMEGAWIARNYLAFHAFVPLQLSFVPGQQNSKEAAKTQGAPMQYVIELRKMVASWGGENFWYFKNSDYGWLVDKNNLAPASEQFGERIFGPSNTPSQLDTLKKNVLLTMRYEGTAFGDSLENITTELAMTITAGYRTDHGFHHYFLSPLLRARNFLVKNVTQDWPVQTTRKLNYLQISLKLLSLAFYAGSLLAFFVLSIGQFRKLRRSYFNVTLFAYVVILFLLFGFVVNAAHFSYFIYGYIPAFILSIFLLPVSQPRAVYAGNS
jgi:4-amino-4-deoxy-L-arabinose transferase-like glycosyltransferase